MQRLQIENEHFQIDILISKSNSMEKCSKSTNEWTFIFVNQRPVNIKILEKILKRIFNDKYPICVINIKINQEELDVNIEPNKTSVFIGKQDMLLELIEAKLKEIFALNQLEKIDEKNSIPKEILQVYKTDHHYKDLTEKEKFCKNPQDKGDVSTIENGLLKKPAAQLKIQGFQSNENILGEQHFKNSIF